MDKRYTLGDVKGKFYATTGQSRGSILWWVVKGELKTIESDGKNFHYQYVKFPDRVFRGRVTKEISGTLTIMPPIAFYSNEENWVNIPDYVWFPIIRLLKPHKIFVEMGDSKGMRILNVIET